MKNKIEKIDSVEAYDSSAFSRLVEWRINDLVSEGCKIVDIQYVIVPCIDDNALNVYTAFIWYRAKAKRISRRIKAIRKIIKKRYL